LFLGVFASFKKESSYGHAVLNVSVASAEQINKTYYIILYCY
jgi:hypothetical protein